MVVMEWIVEIFISYHPSYSLLLFIVNIIKGSLKLKILLKLSIVEMEKKYFHRTVLKQKCLKSFFNFWIQYFVDLSMEKDRKNSIELDKNLAENLFLTLNIFFKYFLKLLQIEPRYMCFCFRNPHSFFVSSPSMRGSHGYPPSRGNYDTYSSPSGGHGQMVINMKTTVTTSGGQHNGLVVHSAIQSASPSTSQSEFFVFTGNIRDGNVGNPQWKYIGKKLKYYFFKKFKLF